jgi:hypothetical protein
VSEGTSRTINHHELDRLADQSDVLRKRLHRIVVALGMTEELRAIACRRMAAGNGGGGQSQRYEAQASHADVTAKECRDFARRLER